MCNNGEKACIRFKRVFLTKEKLLTTQLYYSQFDRLIKINCNQIHLRSLNSSGQGNKLMQFHDNM